MLVLNLRKSLIPTVEDKSRRLNIKESIFVPESVVLDDDLIEEGEFFIKTQ